MLDQLEVQIGAEPESRVVGNQTLHSWCHDVAKETGEIAARLVSAKPTYLKLSSDDNWRKWLVVSDLLNAKRALEAQLSEL